MIARCARHIEAPDESRTATEPCGAPVAAWIDRGDNPPWPACDEHAREALAAGAELEGETDADRLHEITTRLVGIVDIDHPLAAIALGTAVRCGLYHIGRSAAHGLTIRRNRDGWELVLSAAITVKDAIMGMSGDSL